MQTQETIQDFTRTLRQMLSDSERVRSFGDNPFSADEITAYLRQFKSADKERTRYGIADILTNVLIANIDFSKDEIELVFKESSKHCRKGDGFRYIIVDKTGALICPVYAL